MSTQRVIANFPAGNFPPAYFLTGNFPPANFHAGNFPLAYFPTGNFPPANFPAGNFPFKSHITSGLCYLYFMSDLLIIFNG